MDHNDNDTTSTDAALAGEVPPILDPRVTLDVPITRGSAIVTHVDLRKPLSGALRGVALVELMQMDVTALTKVLPRITTPPLTEADVKKLDPADLVQMGVVVAGFLLPKSANPA